MLLTSIANAANHTKFTCLSNQKCEIQPTLINLHPNEYNQELHYYQFAVQFHKYVESFNTLNDLSNKVCVPNKTEGLDIHIVNMITGRVNQKFRKKIYHVNVNVNLMEENLIRTKCGIMINTDASLKNIIYVKKIIFVILLHVLAKMENI